MLPTFSNLDHPISDGSAITVSPQLNFEYFFLSALIDLTCLIDPHSLVQFSCENQKAFGRLARVKVIFQAVEQIFLCNKLPDPFKLPLCFQLS